MFELDNKGRPTNTKLVLPNYKFLVKNGKKEKISYDNLLTKNIEHQSKQIYIMQISNYTQNPVEIKNIYENFDWFEFIFYLNSIDSQQALSN